MNFERFFSVIDSHTEGEPTRVVIGRGAGILGNTMAEKRDYFEQNMDHIRRMLVYEPRGHQSMFVAFLVPPTTDEADIGVLFMCELGCIDMCGHASIGVATVLIETGIIAAQGPETKINLDTPAGVVKVRANVFNGSVRSCTIRNVPCFYNGEYPVGVPALGNIKVDVAFGGNFYGFVSEDDVKTRVVKENLNELLTKGRAVLDAVQKQVKAQHPANFSIIPRIGGIMIYGAPLNPKADAKNIVLGAKSFDRSPCGTGTSARMAILYAKGKLGLNEEFIHESIVGSLFRGKLIQETKVGEQCAVIPEVTGSAYITGFNNIVCSANDPFKDGFSLY